MKHTIEFVKLEKSKALEMEIKETLNKIKRKFNWVISAEVFIKKENDKTGKGKICEIKLNVPGSHVFASSNDYTFESAVLNTQKELERQLKKTKEVNFAF